MKLGYEKPIKKQTLDELYHSVDELSAMGRWNTTRFDRIVKEIKSREKKMKEELSKIILL